MSYRCRHMFLKAPPGSHGRGGEEDGVDGSEDMPSPGQGLNSLFAQDVFSLLCLINLCTNAR